MASGCEDTGDLSDRLNQQLSLSSSPQPSDLSSRVTPADSTIYSDTDMPPVTAQRHRRRRLRRRYSASDSTSVAVLDTPATDVPLFAATSSPDTACPAASFPAISVPDAARPAELCAETSNRTSTAAESVDECSICLQSCTLPVRLPCGHVFCFLCAKGSASWQASTAMMSGGRCAMCRAVVPAQFWLRPALVDPGALVASMTGTPAQQQDEENSSSGPPQCWFYQGAAGWWQYDDLTNSQLEQAFAAGESTCRLLLAGHEYVVDFDEMMQRRLSNLARKRRVKRDLFSCQKKGVAGLRVARSG